MHPDRPTITPDLITRAGRAPTQEDTMDHASDYADLCERWHCSKKWVALFRQLGAFDCFVRDLRRDSQ